MDEKMKTLCYRLSDHAYEKLQQIATRSNSSIKDISRKIAEAYADRQSTAPLNTEKREFIRNKTDLPVVIQFRFEQGKTFFRTGMIKDISMGGARITLPAQKYIACEIADSAAKLKIQFRLPGADQTSIFICSPARCQRTQGNIEFGAKFTGSDLSSRQALHGYIMQ